MKTRALLFCCLASFTASVQESPAAPANPGAEENEWEFELDFYQYLVPFDRDNLLVMAYADYGNVHYEARYNYEDLNTASVFGGYRLETGNEFVFGATPIGGIVFGNVNGVAPGLLLDATWKKFDFYSESEYVVDFSNSESNFFYTWTELAYSPVELLRTGLSANRTRLYETDLEIQRGIFAEVNIHSLTAGFHWFNPTADEEFYIVTLAISF